MYIQYLSCFIERFLSPRTCRINRVTITQYVNQCKNNDTEIQCERPKKRSDLLKIGMSFIFARSISDSNAQRERRNCRIRRAPMSHATTNYIFFMF